MSPPVMSVTEDRPVRRLLFLLPFAPRLDAVHGGSRTMAQLLATLADRHRIALFYLRAAEEPSVDDGLRGRCELVEEVRRDSSSTFTQRLLRRASMVRSRLNGTPRWVAEWA